MGDMGALPKTTTTRDWLLRRRWVMCATSKSDGSSALGV